jgi:hypothetical protein
MTLRPSLSIIALVLVVAGPVSAAGYTTENFVVDAPTKELAKQFGEYAEKYRREKALEWIGTEMPRWPHRCPLRVEVTPGRTGGATTFTFGVGSDRRPGVMEQKMHIFGGMDQLLNSVLPHEITHTVLAHRFGQAVPRWADEGGSVLSENDEERFNHDVRCREVLNQGRGIPLRHLFTLKEYPRDMIVLYAQGYSITEYLVNQCGGRRKFLDFVGMGMRSDNKNWEEALQAVYGDQFSSLDDLQDRWIAALGTPPVHYAARGGNGRGQDVAKDLPSSRRKSAAESVASAEIGGGKGNFETRSSAAAGLPMLEPPVVARGAAPEQGGKTFGGQPVSGSRGRTEAETMGLPRLPMPTLLPPEAPNRR